MHTTTTPTTTPASALHPRNERLLGFLAAPFQARTWRATAYNLVGLAAGVVWFTLITIGLTLGISLAVTLVGIPLIAVTLFVARAGAATERWRAGWIDGALPPAPAGPEPRTLSWAGLKAQLLHAKSWTSTLYLIVLLPVGIATWTVALTTWAYALAALTLPFWYDSAGSGNVRLLGYVVRQPADELPVLAAGAAALFLAPWINRGVARINVALVRRLASG